jgi:hypothetical protein
MHAQASAQPPGTKPMAWDQSELRRATRILYCTALHATNITRETNRSIAIRFLNISYYISVAICPLHRHICRLSLPHYPVLVACRIVHATVALTHNNTTCVLRPKDCFLEEKNNIAILMHRNACSVSHRLGRVAAHYFLGDAYR